MNKTWVTIIIIILVAAGAFFLFMDNEAEAPVVEETVTEEVMESASPSAVMATVILDEQNESSESGTAVLTEENGQVKVTLNMTGSPANVPQPAHIHAGACPDVGDVVYPLTNVVNGVSETMIQTTLADLASKQPLGINVHKSVPEVSVYVACGDLAL